jgi:hypothetical protein
MDTSASDDDDDPITLGGVPAIVYPAMLGATVAGQLLGMALDAAVVGARVVWIPLACSVLLEALVGARFGAARLGQPLTRAQCARLSAYYSACLAVVTLPLWGWTAATRESSPSAGVAAAASGLAGYAVLAVAALLVATFARAGLLMLLTPKRLGAPR